MCPVDSINSCIIIQPPRETRISCYTNLSQEQKILFDNASIGCMDCMNSKKLNYDENLVLDDSIARDIDQLICQKIKEMILNFGNKINPIPVPLDITNVKAFLKKTLKSCQC